MAVLIINGSAHENKCTYTGLDFVRKGLSSEGIESELIWIGQNAVKPCIGCRACAKLGICTFGADDGINEIILKAKEADGLVLGSPVYFAGINGAMKSVLDRVFFAGSINFYHKPGAVLVSARRAGTTAALEQLNKYITFARMPLVSSFYWPMVHGGTAEDVLQDAEGTQNAYYLGQNMAWLIKSIEAGRAAGVAIPTLKERPFTNFIR
jgi:multimeric flavodoxin WrbA